MRSRWIVFALLGLTVGLLHCSSSNNDDDGPTAGCGQPDQDGIIGGSSTFEMDVSDTGFSQTILKAQNSATITLTVKNTGTKQHDFVVDCLTSNGCTACFPDAAKIAPLASGDSKTVTFTAPVAEGIYNIHSDVVGDAFTAQFILQ